MLEKLTLDLVAFTNHCNGLDRCSFSRTSEKLFEPGMTTEKPRIIHTPFTSTCHHLPNFSSLGFTQKPEVPFRRKIPWSAHVCAKAPLSAGTKVILKMAQSKSLIYPLIAWWCSIIMLVYQRVLWNGLYTGYIGIVINMYKIWFGYTDSCIIKNWMLMGCHRL